MLAGFMDRAPNKKNNETQGFHSFLIENIKNSMIFYTFSDSGGVAGGHGPGLGCGHGRASHGTPEMLKSNENSTVFNSSQENARKPQFSNVFLNSTYERKTHQPDLITDFAT